MLSDPLTPDDIRAALGTRAFKVFDSVASTQEIARDWAFGLLSGSEPAPNGAVVITEYQSAGRGRQGRTWVAPPGSSLMLSVVLRPTIVPRQVPRMSIVGGLAVVETLAAFEVPGLALKWPNDVLVNGKKICGVLPEATWDGDHLAAVILGMGINIRADFSDTELAPIATSLETEIGRGVDRRIVLANLLGHVDRWTAQASTPALIEAWQNWLSTLGRRVTVYTHPQDPESDFFTGVAEHVDEDGALFVRLDSGELRRVLAADVSLRENGED